MDNKKLGLIIIGAAIMFLVVLVILKIQLNNVIRLQMEATGGSCFVGTGKCLHEQSEIPLYFGGAAVFLTLSLGIYLIFFEKSQKAILDTLKETKDTLKETKKKETSEEKFSILLQGLDEDEKKVLKAIKEQDGITQATLRLRTDLSKPKLSLILGDFEKKELIKRVKKGKTNLVFLKKNI